MAELPDSRLVQFLKDSSKILIFTGAGISTGSGIPDYRGPHGIWTKRMPINYQEFMTSEDARIKYWEYKSESWENYRNAKPNRVHKEIVKLELAHKLLMVVTQNIDGLHKLAGTSEELLVELHGTMSAVECQKCRKRSAPDSYYEYFKKKRKVPLCECGGYIKPATISFGQNLREKDLERAFNAAAEADLVISLGSTLSVTPASAVPLRAAERGVPYVIVNRGITEHDRLRALRLRLDGDVETLFSPAVKSALA